MFRRNIHNFPGKRSMRQIKTNNEEWYSAISINVLEIIGLLLIGLVSIDTYGSKRRIKPQIAFGLLVIAGMSFIAGLVLLIISNV
ncbi:hypothetical protein BG31_15780 [Bacillus subtilis subsp. subtilis]|nr:hypothetical protein BG31_15780 [Bacillus subtilis subsp. subtilis]